MKGKSENAQNIYFFILDLIYFLHNRQVSAQILFEKIWRFGFNLREEKG